MQATEGAQNGGGGVVGTGPAAVGRGRPFWDGRARGRLAGIPEQGEQPAVPGL